MKKSCLWWQYVLFAPLVLLLGAFLVSCAFDEVLHQQTNKQNENFLSQDSVKSIAEHLRFHRLLDTSSKADAASGRNPTKEIESILDVPDSSNVPAYYIINYKEGGFVILAGDRRSEPVLAFSEINRFDWQAELFPSGLVGWLFEAKGNIERIRRRNEAVRPEIRRLWDNLTQSETDATTSKIEPEDPDCTPYLTQKGPLLQTVWHQGCGYNQLTPAMSCGPCDNAFTGCVATAMAQVMKYHRHPTNYFWSDMPNTYGTLSTAGLMRDIGNAVGMDYGCEGSEADTRNAELAFKYFFNYSTATYADYNYQTVKNEISNNRPVILRGGRNTGWWIFGQYSDGHAWVCDGSLEYVDPCGATILKFNMNWGWGNNSDSDYNGWYSFNNFNPGTHTFNYKTGMVYNIKP